MIDTSKITCGIKTFDRSKSCNTLLKSIYAKYPEIKCVVADDGKVPGINPDRWPHVKYVRLPFDVGLGAGRNAMIDAVETEYCVYLDDDYVMYPGTKLGHMETLLEKDIADIVCGRCYENGRYRIYHGTLAVKDRVLHYYRKNKGKGKTDREGVEIPYEFVDIGVNFFMGRTQMLQDIKWDPKLKINTHTEFFLRASKVARIAYIPTCAISHKQTRPKGYGKYRYRKYLGAVLRKHGLRGRQYHGKWG